MQIEFLIGGQPATFSRSYAGRAELRVGEAVFILQRLSQLSTHMSVRTRRTWNVRVGDHDVEIVKRRPRFWAGFRPNFYSVAVDGLNVATATGT